MQMKALSWDCATIPEKIQRTGWRDAGRYGPHPKNSPGRGPLAAVPPGGRGTIPRTWRQYLTGDAVQPRKVVPERYDPAPGRVAPDAGGRKRRCGAFV